MLETKGVPATINSPSQKPILAAPIKASRPHHHHNHQPKDTMDFLGFRNVNKVLVGDFQILIASLLFGFGFIGQRAVAVDGLGPMTCNAFRFTVSAIIIFTFLPLIDQPKTTSNQDATSSTISILRILFHKMQEYWKEFLVLVTRVINYKSNANAAQASTPAELITKETIYTDEIVPIPTPTPGVGLVATAPNPVSVLSSVPSLDSRDPADPEDDSSSSDSDGETANDLEGGGAGGNKVTTSEDNDNTTSKYYRDLKNLKRNIMFWGIILGLINFSGSGFQQWGIEYTTANKVAFISGFDLFFTPILTLLIPSLKSNGKPSLNIWIAVLFAIEGLYLLSDMNISELSMGHGEFFAMISALFWSLHIIYTDIATYYIDSIYMIAIQSLIVGVLSLILALATESMPWLWYHFMLVVPWLICLSFIEALGLVFMIKGQKYSPPTHAAIITSLEGVFASAGSYLFLRETLSTREVFGCLFLLCAAFITELKISLPFYAKKSEEIEKNHHHHHLHNQHATASLIELTAVSEEHTHRH
jgi:drug/metabolite transporter (DMT)-like permease